MKFEILEHKADLKIKVFGSSLEELFKNAVLAMASILKKPELEVRSQEPEDREILKVESLDKETLLIDFLNEILAKSQINKKIYKVENIKIKVFQKNAILEAELIGYPIEHFDEDIKAATYHNLKISQKDDKFEAVILFDI